MMLKDGKFIREQPPVIGGNFYKTEKREYSEEELEWQETFLAAEEAERARQAYHRFGEIFGGILIVIGAILFFILIFGASDA